MDALKHVSVAAVLRTSGGSVNVMKGTARRAKWLRMLAWCAKDPWAYQNTSFCVPYHRAFQRLSNGIGRRCTKVSRDSVSVIHRRHV